MMTATTLSSSHSSHDLIEYDTRSRSSSTGVSVGRLLVNWFWVWGSGFRILAVCERGGERERGGGGREIEETGNERYGGKERVKKRDGGRSTESKVQRADKEGEREEGKKGEKEGEG